MAAGDFLASVFPRILLKESEMWKRGNQNLTASTNSLQALTNRQTANFGEVLGTSKRDKDIDIYYAKFDPALDGVGTCVGECSPDGTELESAKETYSLVCIPAHNIAILKNPSSRKNAMTFEDQFAMALQKQKKEIKDALNLRYLNFLGTSTGTNALPDGTLPNVDSDNTGLSPLKTFITDANWNANVFSDFQIMAQINNFGNFGALHGANMLAEFRNYELEALNADQKDRLAKSNLFQNISDPLGFSKAGILKSSFMLDYDAVAFGSKYYHEASVPTMETADKFRWHSKDNDGLFTNGNDFTGGVIKGLYFDHTYTASCVSGATDTETKYILETRAHYIMAKAPEHTAGNTGIIEVVRGIRA